MIQRIQTVFLILVIVGMIAYLFLPFWIKIDATSGNQAVFTALGMKLTSLGSGNAEMTYTPYLYCGLGAIVVIVIAAFEIFQYKNRLTQLKLGMINSIVMSLTLFFSAWLAMKAQHNIIPGVPGTFKLGLFAPVFSMIFNSLANRYIKKDEDLVRSVDRLR
jgi:hypothetical protein